MANNLYREGLEEMKKITGIFLVIAGVLMLGVGLAWSDMTVNVNVAGTAMPWYANAGLNSAYMYGNQDGSGPTIVDSGSGFSFVAGGTFTLAYLSGLTNPFGGTPLYDANGDTAYKTKYYSPYPTVVDAPGSTGRFFPTKYVSLPNDPTAAYYLNALVGTFADASGAIMGSPFFVGNGPVNVTVPLGAAQLQLGVNDDKYNDNSGKLLIAITGPIAIPVPGTALLFGSGLLGLVGLKRKFHG